MSLGSGPIYTYSKERTARTGQPEQDMQDGTCRTGHAGRDMQGRTGQAEQAEQAEQDGRNRNALVTVGLLNFFDPHLFGLCNI